MGTDPEGMNVRAEVPHEETLTAPMKEEQCLVH